MAEANAAARRHFIFVRTHSRPPFVRAWSTLAQSLPLKRPKEERVIRRENAQRQSPTRETENA